MTTMTVAVVDAGSGNLASVARALEVAGRVAGVAVVAPITRDPSLVAIAHRIVLPGQGAFAACRAGLAALPGMEAALEARVRGAGVPFLGICVGMQLLAERGLEHGETPGLGWLPGQVVRMDPRGPDGSPLPLPQMGWNRLAATQPHPLLAELPPEPHAYFVHSYMWAGGAAADEIASTAYGGPVTAMVARGNIAGTQFHVEKSGALGIRLLAAFLRWAPG